VKLSATALSLLIFLAPCGANAGGLASIRGVISVEQQRSASGALEAFVELEGAELQISNLEGQGTCTPRQGAHLHSIRFSCGSRSPLAPFAQVYLMSPRSCTAEVFRAAYELLVTDIAVQLRSVDHSDKPQPLQFTCSHEAARMAGE